MGAVAAQTSARRSAIAKAAVIGALGGMAPDLDVLIRSTTDPLLFIEYHRHFTHSLFFVPIGGPLCGWLIFWVLGKRWGLTLKQCLLWSTVGYATHGLLDAFTSYGTRLLWPFSNSRVAWDLVSVIDPLFTLPTGVLLWLAVKRRSHRFTVAALTWMVAYLGVAGIQHHRAVEFGRALAIARGHEAAHLTAKPSFGNIIVWKLIYRHGDRFHVDAVRPGPIPGVSTTRYWEGDSILALDIERDFSQLDPASQQYRDVGRFALFSENYLAIDPAQSNRIADIRYSLLPHEVEPLWGIEIEVEAGRDAHAHYYTQREDSRSAVSVLWRMIKGEEM